MARPRTKYLEDVPCGHCSRPVKPQMRLRKGKFNGMWRAQRFCSKSCANFARPKKVKVDRHGYIYEYLAGGGQRQIYQHRLVMESMLGRKLLATETVHHKNGNRTDNRPENLELWSSRHGRGQRASDLLPALSIQENFLLGMLALGG